MAKAVTTTKAKKPAAAPKTKKAASAPKTKTADETAVKADNTATARKKKRPVSPAPEKQVEVVVPAAAETADSGKKRSGRKSKKAEVVTGTVIGSPRLPGLRPAPGVKIERVSAPAEKKQVKDTRKLSKKELLDIKERLLEMRESNLVNLRKKLEDAQERYAQATADVIDQASDACDEDISLEIAATKDEQLQLINTALERIENNNYGICIMCGEQIAPSRLRLLPFVVRCKSCRDIYDRTIRRHDVNWALVNGSGSDDGETEDVIEEQ